MSQKALAPHTPFACAAACGRGEVIVLQLELRDYQTRLKSLTGGHGSHSIELSHCEAVPPHTQAERVKIYKVPAKEEE